MKEINFHKDKKTSSFCGLILIEVVISVSILLVVFLSLIAVYNYYIKVSINNIPLIKSSYLLEEDIEVVKILRDDSWTSKISPLTLETKYYIVYNVNAPTFDVTLTPQSLIDGVYQRTFTLSSVTRDSDSDIQSFGNASGGASGTIDTNTKKLTVTVSWWNGSATTTKQLSTYITNIFNN